MGLLPPRATARMTGLPARGSLPGPVLLLLACCSTASPPPAGAAPPSGLPAPAGLVVAGESSAPLSPPGLRLPATFRPTAQRVELTIVPSSGSFEGTTELDGELASASDVVWLNARALVVKTATALSGGTETSARPFTSPERVALRFPRQLGPGRATLRLAFSGVISATELSGVFHQEEGGDFYAMTQFEETDARRAFPCVDEPNAKIPWELTLRVPAGLTAVSNTPVVSQEPDGGGMKRVHFARTKPLPPYLVAFGVGPYDVAGARPAGPNGVPMRVYALRSRAAEAAYAARTSPEILEVLETYFGIPYPFEKLDVLAIPLFNGAMENAGLVTIGSRWLLARRQDESLGFQRTWAAYFAAHEFAHQWFGDLVTLAWWDDTWLNESFATWMANKAVNTWAPGWGYDVEDVTDRSAAATADTLATARSIRQPIETYDDISNAFDRISYEKGAAVLRMFESYLGKEPFRDGVRRYLAAHAYGNATASDFLAAISEATGRDVAPAFNSFLDQSGVPELTVALSCPRGKEPGLELAQRRLIPVGSTAGDDRRWQVPVCARWAREGKEQRACTLLTAPAARLALGAGPCPDWVLPNAGYTGYYRLKLEGSLLRALVERGRRSLTTAETVGLLGDVDALVNARALPRGPGAGALHALRRRTGTAGDGANHRAGHGAQRLPRGRRGIGLPGLGPPALRCTSPRAGNGGAARRGRGHAASPPQVGEIRRRARGGPAAHCRGAGADGAMVAGPGFGRSGHGRNRPGHRRHLRGCGAAHHADGAAEGESRPRDAQPAGDGAERLPCPRPGEGQPRAGSGRSRRSPGADHPPRRRPAMAGGPGARLSNGARALRPAHLPAPGAEHGLSLLRRPVLLRREAPSGGRGSLRAPRRESHGRQAGSGPDPRGHRSVHRRASGAGAEHHLLPVARGAVSDGPAAPRGASGLWSGRRREHAPPAELTGR